MNYYNSYGYQQPYQQMQTTYQPSQTTYHPLTFVSGLVGAQAFIVSPGQTVYLMDIQDKMLYIKTADTQGRYSLQSFSLVDNTIKPNADYVSAKDLEGVNARLSKLEEMIYNAKQSNADINTTASNE